MKTGHRILVGIAAICLAAGCSSSAGPKLVPAKGTVTFQGKPLAGATVMFVPEKGPVAMGISDLEGKFQVSTGSLKGVVVGPVKVAVTVNTPGQTDAAAISKQPKSEAEAAAYLKQASEMQSAMAAKEADVLPKSLIPEQYTSAETSGLAYTVQDNGENDFKIELQ